MGNKITPLVNTEAIERNRYYFFILIDIVAFLATYQLAFREKIDAFESEYEGKSSISMLWPAWWLMILHKHNALGLWVVSGLSTSQTWIHFSWRDLKNDICSLPARQRYCGKQARISAFR